MLSNSPQFTINMAQNRTVGPREDEHNHFWMHAKVNDVAYFANVIKLTEVDSSKDDFIRANINYFDENDSYTPLFLAAKDGFYECATFIIFLARHVNMENEVVNFKQPDWVCSQN